MGDEEKSGVDDEKTNRNAREKTSCAGRRKNRRGLRTDRYDQHDRRHGKTGTPTDRGKSI